MTLDMTFEAREKIIRRDEFAAGEAKGKAEGIADITGESVDSIREIVSKK